MRKIKVFYLFNDYLEKKENKKQLDLAIKEFKMKFKNSLLEFCSYCEDGIIYNFHSHFKFEKEKIHLQFKPFLIHKEEFFIKKILESIISRAYIQVLKNQIDCQPIDESKTQEIIAVVTGIFNRYSMQYNRLTPLFENLDGTLNIIDLVNDIFVTLLMDHILLNGNKRLAITFLSEILYIFGFYLKYKSSDNFNTLKWISFTEELIKYHQKNKNLENTKKISKKFILDNIFIALNFYEW